MALQRRHLLALLVSVAAHLGLVFAIGSDTYPEATRAPGGEQALLVVYLAAPDRSAMTAASQAAPAPPQGGQTAPPAARPKRPALAQRPQETLRAPPVERTLSLRHFPLRALTQAPQLASGLIGDALLVVSGIDAQRATIQVWINDQGEVDRVAIVDSDLSEERKQQVIAAFSMVKFHPGKIGRIPVNSEMRMDILLESEIKL